MVRRSPCEFYLKYLILRPDRLSNEKIREITAKLELDYVGDWYVDRLRDSMHIPSPFYPTDPKHVPSQRFLGKERLNRIFQPDTDMRSALSVLERPRVKEFIESMILAGAPAAAMSVTLRKTRKFEASSAAIDLYRHYFWNIELVNSTELRTILYLRTDAVGEHPNAEIKAQASAVRKASYNDPRRVASELPASPISAMIAQLRMGFTPKKAELSLLLEQVAFMGSARALEALQFGGVNDSKKALDYISAARVAQELIELTVRPDADLQSELSAIVLKTDQAPIPTILQLSDGNHTTELSPLKEKQEEEEDVESVERA